MKRFSIYLRLCILLIFCATPNFLKAQIADGTELTIDFTGFNQFVFADLTITLTEGAETYKLRFDIDPSSLVQVGDASTKGGTSGQEAAFGEATVSFDFNNDGTFGGSGDEFTVVSMNVGTNSTDADIQSVTVTPDGNSGAAFTITSNGTTINEFDLDNPGAAVSGTFAEADYTGIQSLFMSPSKFFVLLDDFVIVKGSPTPSNAAPTASSFTASNGPFEDLVYTFSTSDFGYSDGDADALDHVLIEALPAAGTLFLDANNNDALDGGEAVNVSDQISKANLDAGNLQYIQNGSTNTTFQFEVNDGTDDSSGNYIATLNVTGLPTVTLSQTNASLSESATGTLGTVMATLSNTYGATVTVNLSTSGATAGADFNISTTAITITSGNTTGDATITILDDSDVEGTETLTVEISSVTNGTESGSQSQDFTIANNDFEFSIKVFLEGPLSGTTMSTTINASIPTDPTTVYSGIVSETSSGIPATAVDWVEVELRTGTAAGTKVGTNRAAILKSDGTLVDKDGNTLTLSQADGAAYRIVVHHRNHLSVMSGSDVSPTNGVYTFDFTTAQANSFNNGSDGAIQVGSVFAMISGDIDDDGDVDASDLSTWQGQNGLEFTYVSNGNADLNLDGVINAVDRNLFQQKNNTKTSQVPTT